MNPTGVNPTDPAASSVSKDSVIPERRPVINPYRISYSSDKLKDTSPVVFSGPEPSLQVPTPFPSASIDNGSESDIMDVERAILAPVPPHPKSNNSHVVLWPICPSAAAVEEEEAFAERVIKPIPAGKKPLHLERLSPIRRIYQN